jgi:hypothetical protein
MCAGRPTGRPSSADNALQEENMNTKDGYRTTVEAGCAAMTRAWFLLWASLQKAWAQLKMQFGK